MTEQLLNLTQLTRSFNQAAKRYDEFAKLQQLVGGRLLQRFDYIKLQPVRILDLGCGTGYFLQQLQQRFQNAEIIALDISDQMLLQAKQQLSASAAVCADLNALPFGRQRFDLIFANMSLVLVTDINAVMAELARVLAPNGLFAFTTLGPDTLIELRHSWQIVDAKPHIHDFYDMHDVGDAMLATKMADPVVDTEALTLLYPDLMSIMRDLQWSGAVNQHPVRQRGCYTPRQFTLLEQAYQQYAHPSGKLPVTAEVIYGLAWGSGVVKREQGAEVSVPIAELRRMLRR